MNKACTLQSINDQLQNLTTSDRTSLKSFEQVELAPAVTNTKISLAESFPNFKTALNKLTNLAIGIELKTT